MKDDDGFSMFKWYFLPVIILVVMSAIFGFAIPTLVSAKSNWQPLLALVLAFGSAGACAKLITRIYFPSKKKDVEK